MSKGDKKTNKIGGGSGGYDPTSRFSRKGVREKTQQVLYGVTTDTVRWKFTPVAERRCTLVPNVSRWGSRGFVGGLSYASVKKPDGTGYIEALIPASVRYSPR